MTDEDRRRVQDVHDRAAVGVRRRRPAARGGGGGARARGRAAPRCTAALADLRALVTNARALDVPEPPPTLWPSIEGALERPRAFRVAEDLALAAVRDRRAGGRRRGRAGGLSRSPRCARAGARRRPRRLDTASTTAAAVVPPTDPLLHEAEAEFAQAAAAYERSIEKLRGAARARGGALEPAGAHAAWPNAWAGSTRRSPARASSPAARPGDSAGNEQLFAAYQQKIAFLAAAVHRGGEAGEWDKPGARPVSARDADCRRRPSPCALASVARRARARAADGGGRDAGRSARDHRPREGAPRWCASTTCSAASPSGASPARARSTSSPRSAPSTAEALGRLRVHYTAFENGEVVVDTRVELGGRERSLPLAGSGVDLVVDVPPGLAVEAKTFGGDVSASGLRAGAKLETTGGRIGVSDVRGGVVTRQLRGGQRVAAVEGDVDLDGVEGDMDLRNLGGGRVDARVVDGTHPRRGPALGPGAAGDHDRPDRADRHDPAGRALRPAQLRGRRARRPDGRYRRSSCARARRGPLDDRRCRCAPRAATATGCAPNTWAAAPQPRARTALLELSSVLGAGRHPDPAADRAAPSFASSR